MRKNERKRIEEKVALDFHQFMNYSENHYSTVFCTIVFQKLYWILYIFHTQNISLDSETLAIAPAYVTWQFFKWVIQLPETFYSWGYWRRRAWIFNRTRVSRQHSKIFFLAWNFFHISYFSSQAKSGSHHYKKWMNSFYFWNKFRFML